MHQPSTTVSRREIAELTGKLHAHVMRDIRDMLDQLEIDQSRFGSVYTDAKGENPWASTSANASC